MSQQIDDLKAAVVANKAAADAVAVAVADLKSKVAAVPSVDPAELAAIVQATNDLNTSTAALVAAAAP